MSDGLRILYDGLNRGVGISSINPAIGCDVAEAEVVFDAFFNFLPDVIEGLRDFNFALHTFVFDYGSGHGRCVVQVSHLRIQGVDMVRVNVY